MKKILQRDEPVLRQVAQNVSLEEISSNKIQKVIKEMMVSLDSQDDGVAIAAPQIGYSLRIFVVSKKVETIMREEKMDKLDIKSQDNSKQKEEDDESSKHLVFINPIIKKISKDRRKVEEGCLSVRYLYGKVSRANKVKVEAYDENGKKFERGGTGLLAQVFQHEIDHLDGILFIDKATDLEEIPPTPKGKINE